MILPSPYSYRSVFRNADGSHDWQTELDFGWDLIDRESSIRTMARGQTDLARAEYR